MLCFCRFLWKDLHCHESDAQVPGTNDRSNAANTDFPLAADMPADTTCTGTVGTTNNVFLVKCENPVGPFRSVVPVHMPFRKKTRSGEPFAKSRIDL